MGASMTDAPKNQGSLPTPFRGNAPAENISSPAVKTVIVSVSRFNRFVVVNPHRLFAPIHDCGQLIQAEDILV